MRAVFTHVVAASVGFWLNVLLTHIERRGGYLAPNLRRLHP